MADLRREEVCAEVGEAICRAERVCRRDDSVDILGGVVVGVESDGGMGTEMGLGVEDADL